jgi:hypothetical protein
MMDEAAVLALVVNTLLMMSGITSVQNAVML